MLRTHTSAAVRTAVVAAAGLTLSLNAAPAAVALPGDGGSATYGPGSGTNKFVASIKNTGTTNHLYDYVKVPSGNTVTSCSVVSGFPAGTSCQVNGGGPGTAEVVIGSSGLAPNQTGTFSFVTSAPICTSNGCPDLTGAINSTSSPSNYVDITVTEAPPCKPVTLTGSSTFADGIADEKYPPDLVGPSGNRIDGGTRPYSSTVVSGTVPPGLTVQAYTGTQAGTLSVSGTPTTPGTYHFTVKVSDSTPAPSGPCTVTKSYTLTVYCGGIAITGLTNPNTLGDVGRTLKGTPLTASGGSAPYSWEMVPAGSERHHATPPGATIGTNATTETARIGGVPTEEGIYTFLVRVTDANGCRGQKEVKIYVAPKLVDNFVKDGDKRTVSVTIKGSTSGGNVVMRGRSRAYLAATLTPVANDLRYRKRKIGGHFGDYVTAFSGKRISSYTLTVKKGFQYCFSAEPHAAKGKGWGHQACAKITR